MDADAFKDTSAGTLVPIEGYDPRRREHYRHFAFVPEPLPEDVNLTAQTWTVVGEAMHAIGRLDQAASQLPNPALLRWPSIRREAQSTSALEGTYLPFTEVLEAEVMAEDDDERPSPAAHEILNYVRVAEYAYESVRVRPITVGLVSELQGQLVQGTPAGESPDAGRIRQRQVVIGPEGCSVTEARFVPPPAGDQLLAGMRAWETWVNGNRQMPIVVQAALGHYQFEALHPFNDGNGRIGRLVVVLQLLHAGALHEGLLVVSPWLEARRRAYQDELLRVSQTGDFDSWVRFFAEAVRAQAEATVTQIEDLTAYRDRVRELTRSLRLKGTAVQIAEDLIGRPVVTPMRAKREYGVSYPAANNALARLVEAGVLREVTGRNYGRVFAATEAIEIIQGSPISGGNSS